MLKYKKGSFEIPYLIRIILWILFFIMISGAIYYLTSSLFS
jgi:hypothetical protein